MNRHRVRFLYKRIKRKRHCLQQLPLHLIHLHTTFFFWTSKRFNHANEAIALCTRQYTQLQLACVAQLCLQIVGRQRIYFTRSFQQILHLSLRPHLIKVSTFKPQFLIEIRCDRVRHTYPHIFNRRGRDSTKRETTQCCNSQYCPYIFLYRHIFVTEKGTSVLEQISNTLAILIEYDIIQIRTD